MTLHSSSAYPPIFLLKQQVHIDGLMSWARFEMSGVGRLECSYSLNSVCEVEITKYLGFIAHSSRLYLVLRFPSFIAHRAIQIEKVNVRYMTLVIAHSNASHICTSHITNDAWSCRDYIWESLFFHLTSRNLKSWCSNMNLWLRYDGLKYQHGAKKIDGCKRALSNISTSLL